jgi:cell division GTPase FtsZ
MKQITNNIKSQVEREISEEDIKAAILILTSDRNITLVTISYVAVIVENMIDENAALIWGHVIAESECGITLVVFREMAEEVE